MHGLELQEEELSSKVTLVLFYYELDIKKMYQRVYQYPKLIKTLQTRQI